MLMVPFRGYIPNWNTLLITLCSGLMHWAEFPCESSSYPDWGLHSMASPTFVGMLFSATLSLTLYARPHAPMVPSTTHQVSAPLVKQLGYVDALLSLIRKQHSTPAHPALCMPSSFHLHSDVQLQDATPCGAFFTWPQFQNFGATFSHSISPRGLFPAQPQL